MDLLCERITSDCSEIWKEAACLNIFRVSVPCGGCHEVPETPIPLMARRFRRGSNSRLSLSLNAASRLQKYLEQSKDYTSALYLFYSTIGAKLTPDPNFVKVLQFVKVPLR
jgi:hypothetical protein